MLACCAGTACQFPGYFVTPSDDDDGGASSNGGEQLTAGEQATSGTTTTGGSGAAGASSVGGASETGGGGANGGTSVGAAGNGGGETTSGAAGQAGAGNEQDPLFFDDFEAGTASQWLAIAGSAWSVVDAPEGSGKVYQQNPTFADFYAAVATQGTWTDQIIEAKVKVLNFGGTSTSDVVTIYGRFSNIDNYLAAVLRPDGRVAIRASVGGAPPAAIKTSPNFGVTTDVWYQLRFELVGSSLKLFVDGNLRIDTTDARLSQGTVAIGGTNTAAMFDDVRVTSP
ncbi:MAG TPA: hypothetical protein VHP33_14655 [Polyangiaceae bacterium]|nr:hypothetical protein [Polyangiaceae bacterium]